MVKLEAVKDNAGNIVISEDSFEHLLNCLDNQKGITDSPTCGDDLAGGKNNHDRVMRETQKHIDSFNKQCRDLLHNRKS